MTQNILTIPSVREKGYSYDILSKLTEDRTIFMVGEFNQDSCHILVSQLLFLDTVDNTKPIEIIINSPGGCVASGLSVVDTLGFIKSPVSTVNIGMAASMGSVLLAAGNRGKRKVSKHSYVMVHAVSSGTRGTVHDQEISLNHSKDLNGRLTEFLAERCKTTVKKMAKLMERDTWLNATQAVELGIADEIVSYNLK